MSDADSTAARPVPQPEGQQDASAAGQEQANQPKSKSDPEQRINGLQSLLGRKETERRAAVDERDAARAERTRSRPR